MAAILSLKERESAFKKAKWLLCSNVNFLQEQCFNIKVDVLFVQEINEKVHKLMDSLAANLSKNLDLVERDSPKKRKAEHSSITYESLLQKIKRKRNTYTPTGSGVMMKWWGNITAQELVLPKPKASVASTILRKAMENHHVPGVVAEIEVKTSHSSEVQGIEK